MRSCKSFSTLPSPPCARRNSTLERMGGKKDLADPRFVIQHAGESDYSLLTRTSDGQMLFLANMLSKMKHDTPLGSRIAEVHNGSSLFTGDAGQGESNIRRWIIESDWLEVIVALPLNSPAPSQSAKPLSRSRKPHSNGSKPRGRRLRGLPGRRGVGRLPSR